MFFLPWVVGALVPRCIRKTDKMHAVEKALYYSNVAMTIFSIIVLVVAIILLETRDSHDDLEIDEMAHEHHFGHHRHFLFWRPISSMNDICSMTGDTIVKYARVMGVGRVLFRWLLVNKLMGGSKKFAT